MCKTKVKVAGLLETCEKEISMAMKMASGMKSASDFSNGLEGFTLLRAASMSIQFTTENIKQIDTLTGGKLLSRYPQIDWKVVKGIRDILSHAYGQVDERVIFDTIRNDFPLLGEKCSEILSDVNAGKHDDMFKSMEK